MVDPDPALTILWIQTVGSTMVDPDHDEHYHTQKHVKTKENVYTICVKIPYHG